MAVVVAVVLSTTPLRLCMGSSGKGRTNDPSLSQVRQAAALSSDYLIRACLPNGLFAYRVDTSSGRILPVYNVVRHAGAIYALGIWNRAHPSPAAVKAMARASLSLRSNFLGIDARSKNEVVWSRAGGQKGEASLGAAGLGLAALAEMAHAQPGSVPLADLQGLGRFVVYLQHGDGSFVSRYRTERGFDEDWQSLYYPGEAALGLISLYEIDHNRSWLNAAARALSYLTKTRVGVRDLPADHWALIATAKLLPHYRESACPSSRADLIAHAARVCQAILGP